MADPAEFSPVELDRMEDALETLELADVHDEPSAALRRRLQDYRQILTLSRAAMPMIEVPRGLLDNVLAEARAAAEVPVVAPIAAAPAPSPSMWTRLRRALLLPGVALATTAALVLLIVERNDKSEAPVSGAAQQVAKNDQAPATDKTIVSETRAADARASTDDAPPPPPEPAAGIAAPGGASTPTTTTLPQAAPAIAPKEEPAAAEKKGELGRADEQAEGDYAKQKPADANEAERVVDQDATPRWDIIARGDRARHQGNCDVAKSEYTLALDDLDARVKARAYAGLGLCEAADGRRSAADAKYEQARELDAEIAEFIKNEKPRGGSSSGSSNAARAAKKPKAAPVQAEQALESDERAMDPFGE